jgi:Lrp/AsnC family leucine-responsive transcriptional regulator
MSAVSDVSALHALVRVQLASDVEPGDFEAHLHAEAAVAEAWRLTGDCDYEVRLACRSLADLNTVVTELRDVGGLTSTTLILHRVPLEA